MALYLYPLKGYLGVKIKSIYNGKDFFLCHQIKNPGSLFHIDPRYMLFDSRKLHTESIQNPRFLANKCILLVKFTPSVSPNS